MSHNFLEIRNIHKIYRCGGISKKALCDISFDLRRGEIFALLGVNGAGKTTLSSIICSLHPPTSGDILWQDKSIYKNLLEYRRQIGFCPQQQNLDPQLTLRENMEFQGRYYGLLKKDLKERIDELFCQFDLQEYAAQKVEQLSGGYRQRFLIARALVHRPDLVILDEPTVGLDPQVRRRLWRAILELKEAGCCVLLTTHYLDEAEILADRVCVMDKGIVKVIESPQKLKNDLQKENLEEVFLHLLKEGDQV